MMLVCARCGVGPSRYSLCGFADCPVRDSVADPRLAAEQRIARVLRPYVADHADALAREIAIGIAHAGAPEPIEPSDAALAAEFRRSCDRLRGENAALRRAIEALGADPNDLAADAAERGGAA